jgi:lipopolysaccharide export system protein LptA
MWIKRGAYAAITAFGVVPVLLPVSVPAQTPVSGFSGLNGDNSKKPIDIESDRLEVDDKKHEAIFTGSVTATQGDYNLIAQRIEVFYENSGGQNQQTPAGNAANPPAKKAPAAPASSSPMSSGQIKYIHALGGTVVIKNPKDEQQATGEDAIYDVKTQKITMTGKKVVLTQKKNVVEGRKLLVDLNTGQATVIPDDEPAKGTAAAQKGRVRAVLQQEGANAILGNPLTGAPAKKDDAAKQPPAAPKQPQPAAGWQTQSH